MPRIKLTHQEWEKKIAEIKTTNKAMIDYQNGDDEGWRDNETEREDHAMSRHEAQEMRQHDLT